MIGRWASPIPIFKAVGDQPINNQKSKIKNTSYPIVWTIAGSDSGGGAGVQADLKVFQAHGAHGCSVVTAVTAQNTLGVSLVEPVSANALRAQLRALADDLPPAAVKIGMLGGAEACSIVAENLRGIDAPIVCDPVLKSTSGADLLAPDAVDALIRDVFPLVTVLTPNLPETEALTGEPFDSAETAARRLLAKGVKSVLIKGGHAEGDQCADYWSDGQRSLRVDSERIDTRHDHGTGCVLSSAIAANLALGRDLPEAVRAAKSFLTRCLRNPANIGAGHGPMRISMFENTKRNTQP